MSESTPVLADKYYTAAVRDVLLERMRQIEKEGFTCASDDRHANSSLTEVAACYAQLQPVVHFRTVGGVRYELPRAWPYDWAPEWWKPTTRRRNLVKATALLIAEIERLDRAEARSGR